MGKPELTQVRWKPRWQRIQWRRTPESSHSKHLVTMGYCLSPSRHTNITNNGGMEGVRDMELLLF